MAQAPPAGILNQHHPLHPPPYNHPFTQGNTSGNSKAVGLISMTDILARYVVGK